MDLSTLTTLMIDGDGVLWRSDEPMPGLRRFFDALDRRGIKWALLTNNNTRTVDDYVQKLGRFGVEIDPSAVFTSSTATAAYLKQAYGEGARVHAVGMRGLIDTLRDAGFVVTTGEEVPPHPVVAVAAGMDRAITHAKIKVAMRLILAGAEFVATNTDPNFPTSDGLSPGTGMVIAALETVSGVAPRVIGKPEPPIYEAAMRHLGANPATTAMIGDRLDTDILGAQRAGIGTIAVLTGVATRAQIAEGDIRPDLIFDSIVELTQALVDREDGS